MTVTDEMMAQWDPLVKWVARQFLPESDSNFEDIAQEGRMGLVQALRGFDEERGTDFTTYAVATIRGKIQHYFRGTRERGHHMVRVPGWAREKGVKSPVVMSFDDTGELAGGRFEDAVLERVVIEERARATLPLISQKQRQCLLTKWQPGEGRGQHTHAAMRSYTKRKIRERVPKIEHERMLARRAAV